MHHMFANVIELKIRAKHTRVHVLPHVWMSGGMKGSQVISHVMALYSV